MKELELIGIIKNTLTDSTLIGDDTACIADGIDGLIMTQDTLVEDVHFRLATTSAYELGIKSVAINLSDIAAAGGIPRYILVSLSLPRAIDKVFIQELYKGIDKICIDYGVKVAGGDITGGDKVVITISAIGSSDGLATANRTNASVGDVVAVTGRHGDSRAGLELLESGVDVPSEFIKVHTMPAPRLKEGRAIVKACKSPTMMDTSDGLADALYKIGVASGVTLDVDFAMVPVSDSLEFVAKDAINDWVLFGGEDYELLCCMSDKEFEFLSKEIPLFKIGVVSSFSGVPAVVKGEDFVLNIDEEVISKGSFDHFKGCEYE